MTPVHAYGSAPRATRTSDCAAKRPYRLCREAALPALPLSARSLLVDLTRSDVGMGQARREVGYVFR